MSKVLEKTNVLTPEELAKLIKKKLSVVIKISASWCGPCKNKRFLESYHILKQNYADVDNIKFIELDIDADAHILENKDFYDIEIESVPTFLISNGGNFTKKYEGTTHLEQINKYLFDTIQKNN